MGTTPNYGWTYPAPTNYVKDLPTDLGNLADEIDATVAGLGSGLNLISSSTFTGQSSVSFNNVFTSTYKDYRILTSISCSSGTITQSLRLRSSGTDLSSGVYGYANYRWSSTGTQNYAANNNGTDTRMILADVGSSTQIQQSIDITNPQASSVKRLTGLAQGEYSGVSGIVTFIIGGYIGSTSSYDGFTIYPSSGTISGTISVYGYEI